MRYRRLVSTILAALVLNCFFVPGLTAGDESSESITITIDRKKMPKSLLHPGQLFSKAKTLTVQDYVIRDYAGYPIEHFLVKTASGRTEIPVETVQEIHFSNRISQRTDDIKYVENVVEAEIVFTDGRQKAVLMNADFGTIEGKTELGDFFLSDPHTVRHLVFNRVEETPEPPKEVEIEKPLPPLDSDGDGVPDDSDKCPDTPEGVQVDSDGCPPDSDGDGVADYKDKCPNTPKGATVNSVGCWTIKGIHFDYDKWDIKPQYHGVLDENIKVLELNPRMTVEIQGHTDDIASLEYNQALSEKRAEATKEYFVSKGISENRISTKGFGKTRPIVSNDTPEGRAENRRIEIKTTSR